MTREEAISFLNQLEEILCKSPSCLPDARQAVHEAFEMARAGIKEPKQGEWIKGKEISRTMLGNATLCIDYKDFTCSNCGLVLDRLRYHVDGSPFYNFCPNCGSDNRPREK